MQPGAPKWVAEQTYVPSSSGFGTSRDARALRHNPHVSAALELWWSTAVSAIPAAGLNFSPVGWRDDSSRPGSAPPLRPRHLPATMRRSQYILASRKMYKALHEIWDSEDAQASAEEDWERDSEGKPGLDRARFYICWFELADLWTDDIDRDEYVDFLEAQREIITERLPDGRVPITLTLYPQPSPSPSPSPSP